MKYAVIYSSRTGNTKYLAEALKDWLGEKCMFFGEVGKTEEVEDADVIFAGFWTDKGDCQETMAKFLQGIRSKKIFLFGTAGFGQNESYFQRIVSNVNKHLDQSNQVIGTWMCQGRMSMAVRTRYEAMLETEPEKARQMIDNFDRAMFHPNEEDKRKFLEAVEEIME